jgi:hypothetical protein
MKPTAAPKAAPEAGAVRQIVLRAEIGGPVVWVAKPRITADASTVRVSVWYAPRVCAVLGDSTRNEPTPAAA